jgi:hypothetical protein
MEIDISTLLKKESITHEEFHKIFFLDAITSFHCQKSIMTEEESNILSLKVKKRESSEYKDMCFRYMVLSEFLRYNHYIAKHNYDGVYNMFTHAMYSLDKTFYSELLITKKNANNELDNIIQELSAFHKYFNSVIDTDYMHQSIQELKKGIKKILVFNCAVDLFAEFIEMDEIKSYFTIKMDDMQKNLDLLNDYAKRLKRILTGTKYERERKKKLSNKLFPKIIIENFKPTDRTISKARKQIPTKFKHSVLKDVLLILEGSSK